MPINVPERRCYNVTVLHAFRKDRSYVAELSEAERRSLENTLSNSPDVSEARIAPTDILVFTELRAALREELQIEVD